LRPAPDTMCCCSMVSHPIPPETLAVGFSVVDLGGLRLFSTMGRGGPLDPTEDPSPILPEVGVRQWCSCAVGVVRQTYKLVLDTPRVTMARLTSSATPRKTYGSFIPNVVRIESSGSMRSRPEPKFYLMQQPRPFPFVNTPGGVGVEVCYDSNTCVLLAAPCVLPNLPTRMVICNLACSKLETTAHSCSHKGASNPHTTPPVSSTSSS